MVAISFKDATYEVTHYNIHYNEVNDVYEFWITKTDGRTKKVASYKEEKDAEFLKNGLDHCIEVGESIFRVEE